MRGWRDLGVVDTIYEEEDEDSFTSPSLSSSLSPSPTSLHSRVETWSLATGHKTDILVDVGGSSFQLHKDRLTWRSGYLKRRLTDVSAIILSPPLNITAQTFTLVADFCYGAQPVITPFNVAALKVAADLLEMTENYGDGNLGKVAESYFRRVVAVNREYASIVFRSCLALLPESETTAFLVSRCIEALSLTDEGDSVVICFDDVKTVGVENFQVVADSMHHRFTRSHDILYKIVDHYIKENNSKISEEQKDQLCNTIDCNKLSTQGLMHAVQNPRMPLRFIVRAMFIQQLNTRHSVLSATDRHVPPNHRRHKSNSNNVLKDSTATLGAILQRDAALRQVDQLKAAMDATSSRIQSLEKELNGMKKKLLSHESTEKKRSELLESGSGGRSASFRFSSANKIERGERGSVSSSSLHFSNVRGDTVRGERSSSSDGSCYDQSISPKVQKNNIGRRLMNGLKSAFRVSSLASKHENASRSVSRKVEYGGGEDWKGDDVSVIKDEDIFPSHTRRLSLTRAT